MTGVMRRIYKREKKTRRQREKNSSWRCYHWAAEVEVAKRGIADAAGGLRQTVPEHCLVTSGHCSDYSVQQLGLGGKQCNDNLLVQ